MKGLYCFDIEANGLLDDSTVDYTTSPWSLKDFKIHCIVIENLETGEQTSFVGEECKNFKQFVIDNVDAIIAHNGINYDLTVLKAVYGMDFTLGFEETPSTWCDKDVKIIDTFIMSKTIYPDRQSHSLDYLGTLCGVHKIDWRSEAISLGLIEHSSPKGAEFAVYHPQMLEYNKQDVKTNIAVFKYLSKEMGDWDWKDALELEHYVAWIITRQAHRGFWFDQELALKNVQELDELMAKHKAIVEPHLPEKPLTKTKLKEWTPPATQFLKSGLPNTHIKNFAAKVGGQLVEYSDGWYLEWEGQIFKLPFSEPLKKTEPTSISDSTFIKEFLVGLGWQPSEFKEKDLTLDTKKKKLSPEKFEATVRRYVEQTLASNFLPFRLERVKCTDSRKLMCQLLSHDLSKPLKVLTNPTFTVGQEKNIDPALSELESTFPYVKNIVEYLTYNHRRNSILGGGVDWEDADEEGETGFLPNVRKDGRIPTPADSMGAATARMKHKIVANVPRVTSLYGEPIRRLFGVGKGNGAIQFAYDFCSLEAMVEAHFCWQFDDENKSYCNSLILEKPNDVHTKTAEMISKMLDIDFKRGSAKSVKYACVPMDTQILTRSGWKYYDDIIIGEEVLGYDEKTKTKKWTKLLHKFKKQDEVIELSHNWFNVRATKDHRWFVKQRREFSTGTPNNSIRKAVDEVRTTAELNSESSIIMNAPMDISQDNETSGTFCLMDKKYGVDWSKRVLNMSQAERVSFLEGFMIADGYHNVSKWQWSQNVNELYDAALLASYLVHDGVVCVSTKQTPTNILKTVILTTKTHRGLQTVSKKSLGVQDVWCVTTELGSWVMKQGDTITITGNCAYGAQPPKVAKTVGCDLKTGESIFNAYWEAAKPLAKFKEWLTNFWKTKGQKKFIIGIDGRQIRTRSQHSLVNAAFQSAGVIAAKRTMVYQDILFRKHGISVDFWTEDWKNKAYIQQMIAYHK